MSVIHRKSRASIGVDFHQQAQPRRRRQRLRVIGCLLTSFVAKRAEWLGLHHRGGTGGASVVARGATRQRPRLLEIEVSRFSALATAVALGGRLRHPAQYRRARRRRPPPVTNPCAWAAIGIYEGK